MLRYNRFVITLLLLGLTFCLSILGCSYAPSLVWMIAGDPENSFSAIDAQWRQLPLPPSEVKEIIAVDYFTVYVRTDDGRMLGCYRESRLDTRCWFAVEYLPEVPRDSQMEGIFPEPPPGITVIQEYQIDYLAGRDSRSAFSYILDSNGHIWQWGFERFAYFGSPKVMRISLFAQLGGFLIGILLPLLVTLLVWKDDLKKLVSIASNP